MSEKYVKPYTPKDVERAVALVEQKYPELFERLVRSEIENRPELRNGGGPLISTLIREGFDYGNIGTIDLAFDFRLALISRYVKAPPK
jgi:hypothetical protein